MLESNPQIAFEPTITDVALERYIDDVRSTSFESLADRSSHICNLHEVQSFDDYLIVSALASSDPAVAIDIGDVYTADTVEDFILRIVHAHADGVALRGVFETIDATGEMSQTINIPVEDPEPAVSELDGGDIQRTEFSSTTVESRMLKSSTIIGSHDYPPIGELAQNFAYVLNDQVLDTVGIERSEQPQIELVDAFDQISDAGYIPDTIIAGSAPSGMPDTGGKTHCYGVPVTVTESLPDHVAVVCDSTRVGFEVQFSPLEVSISAEHRVVHPMDYDIFAHKVLAHQQLNWTMTEEDAIAVGRID